MSPVALFLISGSAPSWRVQLSLVLKGLDYQTHFLSVSERQHKAPEFLAINPRGQVPTIRHGDYVLGESLAILAYLDAVAPEPCLFGDHAQQTGRIWRTVLDSENNLIPALNTAARILFKNLTVNDDPALQASVAQLTRELQAVAQLLNGGDYLCGATLSAADIALYPFIQWLRRALLRQPQHALSERFRALLESGDGIGAWERRIESIPGYADTYPPHWRD